jgi:hypothetical protein
MGITGIGSRARWSWGRWNLIYKFTTSVTELGSITDRRPGPARVSRKKNKDAIKAGMHNCRSRNARSSTTVLRHQVSSTRSHSPSPLPSLIQPVYWLVLGSQSLLNPRDHPRYLPPYPIDRTRPGPGGYRHVSRERGPVLLGSQSLLNPQDHPRYLPPYPIDRTRPALEFKETEGLHSGRRSRAPTSSNNFCTYPRVLHDIKIKASFKFVFYRDTWWYQLGTRCVLW